MFRFKLVVSVSLKFNEFSDIADDVDVDDNDDRDVDFLNGDEEKAEAEINDIVMLLEIDSNSKVGFSWWDCGVIHFFIRKEDLKNRNFDKTYLSLYSS